MSRHLMFPLVGFALIVVGCADGSLPPIGGFGGAGSRIGAGGSGGISGAGGGTGATGGAGGIGATGGSGGAGGAGNSGGIGPCATSALCEACPDAFLCESDDDCFNGWACLATGCAEHAGVAIKQCQPTPGSQCTDTNECPEEYTCQQSFGQKRCVKTTPGCNDTFDCVFGFACEGGSCVDRRVPCDDFRDCPKGHVCITIGAAQFCARVQRSCTDAADCADVNAGFCTDVDGDGKNECAGSPEPGAVDPTPCVNSGCGGGTPVCEVADVGSKASCGQYGLCRNDSDCDETAGFYCLSLWEDGRKECVREVGCQDSSECPLQQVCASPRTGGAPSCQKGVAP